MKGSRPVTRTLSCLFLLAMLLPAGAVADESHDRIIAFGDSLVDSGNVFAVTGLLAHKPYEIVPSAPYPIGGPRFSNGPTWVEQLAKRLGAGPSAGPSRRARGVFTNYAYGGARARDFGEVPSLTAQVTEFLDAHDGQAPPDALYAIAIGGNDLRDAAEAGSPAEGAQIIGAAVQAISDNLQALVASGARHFLVSDLPNLSVVPAITLQNDPVLEAAALQASLAFNVALDAVLSGVDALPAVQVHRISAFALTSQLAADPTALGFEDGSTPCLTFGVQGNAICNDRDAHFYWDGIHPTRAGHALIAQRALEAITAD